MENIKDKLFSASINYIKKYNDLIDHINDLFEENMKIPNAGITFNNKLVEILNKYRSNNIHIENSELFLVISTYLLTLLSRSLAIMGDYINILNTITEVSSEIKSIKFNIKKKKELINILSILYKESDEVIEFYKKVDDEIYNFDISKITEDFIKDKEISNILKNEIGNNMTEDMIIENCNIDLISLKYKPINSIIPKEKHKNKINSNNEFNNSQTKKAL